ncbi:MAG: hypothetical protein FWC39_02170 [Bacteroidetes bacterium]|nr:hypothetical protein [Bacteroidota bacterium]
MKVRIFWLIVLKIILCYSCVGVTDYQFSERFEEYTGLPFPASGKIIEKADNGFALDSHYWGTIEMDSLDYMKILNEIQTRCDSLVTNPDVTRCSFYLDEYAHHEYWAHFDEYRDGYGRRFSLSFHKNERFIRCNMESI